MVKLKKKGAQKLTKRPKPFKKRPQSKPKEKFATMSVDSFLEQDFDSPSDEEVDTTLPEPVQNESDHSEAGSDMEAPDSDAESLSGDELLQHKADLAKLQNTDPEFYKFLQENDKKLLQFNISDDEDEAEDDTDKTHKPPTELDVASDESDFEEDDEPKTGDDHGRITLKMLKAWESAVQTDASNKTITILCEAFHAAMLRVSSDEPQEAKFSVEGAAVFNGTIQLCVLQLGPALRKFLGIAPGSKQPPHKCKKFSKVKRILKDYFMDLSKLLSGVSSSNIQTVLLKHLHYMTPFLVSYTTITKSILKRLIKIWGSGDEGVRVLAFFSILRITNNQKPTFLDTVLKQMYMTYVKNSKFVSVSTLASLNFMRRSLVEMFALDLNVAYQHVFLYIRQLAIHLRNAITINKKENLQSVYNWQYVNSLKLWGSLLGATYNRPQLQQLVYPLVQVCLGTVRLVPTAQYYPLRFQVAQILVDLSRDSGVFIPVLPFFLDVLSGYDFGKKHQKVSMKPMQFTCLLRASKSQLVENGFKDALIEAIYGGVLGYLADQAGSICFPDLSLLCTIQIRQFVKKCSNPNYTRKMKQILEKIEQNNNFIESERAKLNLNITDFRKIDGWEAQMRSKGTPLKQFFDSWNKLHTIKKNKQLTKNDELADYNLPKLKKKTAEKRKNNGPVELFPSDSDDIDDDDDSDGVEEEVTMKKRRGTRAGKNSNKKGRIDESGPVRDDGEKDLVSDLNMSDW